MLEQFIEFLHSQPPQVLVGMLMAILLACGLGLPIPEDIILVTAGYLAYNGFLDIHLKFIPKTHHQGLYLGIMCTFLGVMGGDLIIFSLGRKFGPKIFDFKPLRKIATRERIEAAEYYFERYGARFVFVGRFMAGVRAPMFLTAGILKLSFKKFVLYDGLAALISVPLLVWVGFHFGEDIDHAFKLAKSAQHTVLFVLAAAGVIFFVRYILQVTGILGDKLIVDPAAEKFEKQHPRGGERLFILGTDLSEGEKNSMSIFKAYDIRGVVPGELDEKLARRIGMAVVDFLKVERLIVGRDVRTSGEQIFKAFSEGCRHRGADVYDLGRSSTPLLNYMVGKHDFPAGVMITASHNPPKYNGFKICRTGAVPVYDQEIRKIGEMATAAAEPAAAPKAGKLVAFGDREPYFANVKSKIRTGGRRLKIVVDLSNGAATATSPDVLKLLPHDVIVINGEADGNFPNHEPDPLKEENLEQCRERVLKEKADLGAVFDGDADRLVFLDDTGRTVTGDIATLLMALNLIGSKAGETVLYDVRSSWVVREELLKVKAKPDVCRVGHAFIKMAMRQRDALCAGELSGHYYFRDNFYAENTDLALILIVNQLAFTDEPLSRIAGRYRRYFASGEINSEVADKAAMIARLKDLYGSKGRVMEVDGLTVEFDDWWFNLRPSNTEPLLRLNVEAKSPDRLKEKTGELLGIIRE